MQLSELEARLRAVLEERGLVAREDGEWALVDTAGLLAALVEAASLRPNGVLTFRGTLSESEVRELKARFMTGGRLSNQLIVMPETTFTTELPEPPGRCEACGVVGVMTLVYAGGSVSAPAWECEECGCEVGGGPRPPTVSALRARREELELLIEERGKRRSVRAAAALVELAPRLEAAEAAERKALLFLERYGLKGKLTDVLWGADGGASFVVEVEREGDDD